MTYEEPREFCYDEEVRIRDTHGTRNQRISGKRGRVVATAGDGKTESVVVYFGSDRSINVPVDAVVHA